MSRKNNNNNNSKVDGDDDDTHNNNNNEQDDETVVVPSLSMRLDIILTPVVGTVSDGSNHYNSIRQMWIEQGVVVDDDMDDEKDTTNNNKDNNWYQRGKEYYDEYCDETVEGVLGGFGSISFIDLQTSRLFLEELQDRNLWNLPSSSELFRCCEVGAGIGRVSKGLLLPLHPTSTRCDLVEVSEHLLYSAPTYLGEEYANRCRYYCTGLQDWTPPIPITTTTTATTTSCCNDNNNNNQKYRIIWIQWVLCYLTDVDVVSFLQKCANVLYDDNDGIIVLKENTCQEPRTFVLDERDASITRSLSYWLALIDETNCLQVVHQMWQPNFPSELFPVPMLALKKREKRRDTNDKSNKSNPL